MHFYESIFYIKHLFLGLIFAKLTLVFTLDYR